MEPDRGLIGGRGLGITSPREQRSPEPGVSIGVIGPARMNYSRVIPLVDFTAETIGEAIGKT